MQSGSFFGKIMTSHSLAARALLACALLLPLVPCGAAPADVLDTPAATSALAARGLINGLALAGSRVVAVGQRGHIVYSDNRGEQWTQARVPLSADLVAVHFPTPRLGWAVGHDGVVLHSDDGGATWVRQLDVRSLAGQATDPSFLDVFFLDAHTGFAVGAFNLIYHTGNGGQSWQSWSMHVENPRGLHLNAIRAVGKDLFIVGEQGLVLKLDPGQARFVAVPTPYQGSYFGVTGNAGALIVHGLRGNAWRSVDGGASWHKIETGVSTGLTASAVDAGGAIVLVSQSGQVLRSTDGGASFARQRYPQGPASAVLALGGKQLMVGGGRGLRTAMPLAGD
jgi:photosystem II stability/assembly factor-like uncharacterized protein